MTDPRGDVPVRDAATVVLLRDGSGLPGGLEAWLLTRVSQMVFAAGMTVFPGGRVEASDADLPMPGPAPAEVAERFGCPEPLARALLGAAARETFEETGVLLTVPGASSDALAAARAEVECGRLAFGDLLQEHDLAVDAAAFRPWARWVTPTGEVRRYDTRFFVAALPDGADPADVTTEASAAAWVPVGEAVEQAQRGERRLMPPTRITLTSLLPFRTVAEALAAADEQPLDPVRPTLEVAPDGSVSAVLPDGTRAPLGFAP